LSASTPSSERSPEKTASTPEPGAATNWPLTSWRLLEPLAEVDITAGRSDGTCASVPFRSSAALPADEITHVALRLAESETRFQPSHDALPSRSDLSITLPRLIEITG